MSTAQRLEGRFKTQAMGGCCRHGDLKSSTVRSLNCEAAGGDAGETTIRLGRSRVNQGSSPSEHCARDCQHVKQASRLYVQLYQRDYLIHYFCVFNLCEIGSSAFPI